MGKIKAPTADQCNGNEQLEPIRGMSCWAAWYPQMGGYAARCIIRDCGSGCFDVYVWHDGEFPFSDESPWVDDAEPVILHHCNPGQFVRFGVTVKELLGDMERPDDRPSPRPWRLGRGYEQQTPGTYIASAEGGIVYADDEDALVGENLSVADAELVVRAVNAAEDPAPAVAELRDALRRAIDYAKELLEETPRFPVSRELDELREVLAKHGGDAK